MGKESNPEKINLVKGRLNLEPKKENKRLWPVIFDQKGNIIGLPVGVSPEEVIVFKKDDGTWWAENPSPEIIEEIKMWRTNWADNP